MEIKQLQVGYHDTQDRMVLRINIDADKFANLLLTRRVCRFILDQIGPFLKVADSGAAPEDKTVNKQKKSAKKKMAEQTVPVVPDRLIPKGSNEEKPDSETPEQPKPAKPDYKTPFEERSPEGNIFGPGSIWPVVVNAGCTTADGKLSFTLQFESQQTMNLTLSPQLAKGVFRLMFDLAERIQWFGAISAPINTPEPIESIEAGPSIKSSVTYH